MAMNQVQFQRGLLMAEFLDKYGTEEKCHAALVTPRWPEGFRCPACRHERHSTFIRQGRRTDNATAAEPRPPSQPEQLSRPPSCR